MTLTEPLDGPVLEQAALKAPKRALAAVALVPLTVALVALQAADTPVTVTLPSPTGPPVTLAGGGQSTWR